MKRAREREFFRIHVFPIEVGEGKPGRLHAHRVGYKVDDQGIVFVKGIYAAERPHRVLDVRVESYMLRQCRLAAPQSGPAPDIVEGVLSSNSSTGPTKSAVTVTLTPPAAVRSTAGVICRSAGAVSPSAKGAIAAAMPNARSLADGPLTVTVIV